MQLGSVKMMSPKTRLGRPSATLQVVLRLQDADRIIRQKRKEKNICCIGLV